MAQFEEATAAADAATAQGGANGRGGGAVDPADDRKAKVTYVEAIKLCVGALGREAMDGIVREEWSGASFLVRSIPALRPKLRTAELKQQRDNLLALARTPMDRGVLHERMLMSIHKAITKSETLPPRFGPQWEVIGFQGNDPATDLRGAGILALLQVQHLAWKRPKLLGEIFALSKSGTSFPMMTVSINLTQVALQAMRGGALTKEANKASRTRIEQMYEAFHAMHAACFLHMVQQWRRRGLGIADFGFLRKEIEALAVRKPAKLLAALKVHDAGPAAALVDAGGPVSFG